MSTVPVPGSAVAGAVAPSAVANTWRDSAQYLLGASPTGGGGKRPMAILRASVTQSVTTGTATDVLFDTEEADTDNGHSTVTNTQLYTFQTPGTYLYLATVAYNANATGDRAAWFRGTFNSVVDEFAQVQSFAPTAGASGCYLTLCAMKTGVLVGDTLSVRTQHNAGSTITLTSNRDGSRLQVLWLGN